MNPKRKWVGPTWSSAENVEQEVPEDEVAYWDDDKDSDEEDVDDE